MFGLKAIKYALATVIAAAGVFSFSAYADGFAAAEPAGPPCAAAPEDTNTPAPYTPPRYFNPYTPRRDNPTNPPGTWEVYPSPTSNDLYYIDFVDANNGWACGRSVMLRYRNGVWAEEQGHSGYAYGGIDMLSNTEGWAVGWDGNQLLPTIRRWDGSAWKDFQNPTGAVECIDMIDSNRGWIGGTNYFLSFNGSQWVWGGPAPSTMMGIDMLSGDVGWAVGYRYILRRTSSGWVVDSNNNWVLGGVRIININKGYASGYDRGTDKGAIIKYDGSWSVERIFTNTETIGGLDIYAGDFGWCVGRKTTTPPYGGFIAFFDGRGWNEVNCPTDNALGGVKIIDRDNAWAVGYYGTILKYKPNVSVRETSLGKIKATFR
jgi:hypothetical protein